MSTVAREREAGAVVEERLLADSRRFYLFFGGLQGRLGTDHFEFMRSAGVLGCSRLFLRDPHRAWYQRGLPGIGEDVHAVARYLEQRIASSGASEVRFVGNCMGGYAALLFCSLLRTGRAIAFAPQTLIGPGALEWHPGQPVADAYAGMFAHRNDRHIYDLPEWLRIHTPELEGEVYCSANYPIDIAHAEALRGFPNIAIHHVDMDGHGVSRFLRQQGRLKEILSA
ncbi:MAG: hypothetical protein Q8Q73_10130 [Stagnimonas sp.]|nr:hypothetical protein [Stagnimonas sp.]